MRGLFLGIFVLLVACDADHVDFPTPTPDPVASSSGTGGAGGDGGAGGGGDGANIGWQSGTRLRAMTVDSGDGARQFWGWWDSERNERCNFTAAADGELRCLPSARVAAAFWGDPGCATTRLIAAQTCLPSGEFPTYAAQIDQTQCTPRTRILALVGQWQSTVWQGVPNNCTQVAAQPETAYYEVGAEVPASSFAAGDIVTE